jgi:phage terminase large subunit-like protein
MDGIYFDSSIVSLARLFAHQLTLTKCTQSGLPERLELLPHSLKLVANLLGWKREDGRRLYRKAYWSVARKNTKTQTVAFLADFMLFMDPEPEQEIYIAAKELEQASLCYEAALSMIRTNPELEALVDVKDYKKLIIHRETGSRLKAVSSEGKSKHGFNPSMVIFDELHVWGAAEQELYDALTSGSGARREPLRVVITTAGSEEQSICYREYDYARRVMNGTNPDPTYLPMIWELPRDADWTDESLWHLANPALDTVVQRDELRAELHKALSMPHEQNKFRRLYLNQWVNATEQWIPLERWDECKGDVDLDFLENVPCYGGLDLAAVNDLTAFVLAWPVDNRVYFHPWFFIPKDGIEERSKRDNVRYDQWAKQKQIELTPGNVTDWRYATAKILELAKRFKIREIAFDRWGARDTAAELSENGLSVYGFGQGFKDFTAPSKRMEEMALSKRLVHDGHPILRWNVDCCSVATDAAGCIKPVKPDLKRSNKRIDGVVAAIMALHCAMQAENQGPSIYENAETCAV